MSRLIGVLVVAAVLDIFAIIDLITIDKRRLRAFSKPAWFAIIILVPIIGAILWFAIGRGRALASGGRTSVAPDDNPEFLANLGKSSEQEERIRRLEEELANLDSELDESAATDATDDSDRSTPDEPSTPRD